MPLLNFEADAQPRFRKTISAVGFIVRSFSEALSTASPSITTGTGVPTSTEPNGSIYLRTDGAAATTIYVRAAGAWTANA
jgi:hypothetical protein